MNLIRDILQFWTSTWRQSKILFFAEAIGALSGMTAATIMAVGAPDPNLFAAFSLYVLSSVLLMYASFKRQSSWMLCLMTFYTIITSIGIYNLFT